MKNFSISFRHFIFLSLFYGHLTYDPDSVMVQSPEDNALKAAKLQEEEGQIKAFISAEKDGTFVRTFMRPSVIDSGVVWKEVHRETLDLKHDSIPFQNGWKELKTVQPNSRTTTQKSIVNSEPSIDSKSQIPPNTIKGNNNNGNSETINSSPAAAVSEEERFENEHSKNPVTKSPGGKISPDSNFFAGIVNDFAFKLAENLNLESNFVISPLSIFIALSMCYLGADGNTKLQMEKALGMNENAVHGEHLHQGIKDLLSLVARDTRGYKLLAANGMFLGRNFTVDARFEENIKKYYDAELENLDFGKFQGSQQLINKWVARSTNGMIRKIISSSPLPSTSLMLLNAIYFEGYWKKMFPPNLTYERKFYAIDGKEKEVQFMSIMDQTFPVFRSDEHNHTFIKLPYEGDQVSMLIALPYTKEQKPMPSVTNKILCHTIDALRDTKLRSVAIPKCRLEYRKSLIKPLLGLGIKDLFDSNAVDLRSMRKENDIYASDITHKAVVQINEAGTKASASTSIMFIPKVATFSNINFVADHPFAFYIVHEASGLVLFYGKVLDFDEIKRGK